MSRDESWARRVTPLRWSVVSATQTTGWPDCAPRRAPPPARPGPRTWLATLRNRRSTSSRRSSMTGVFRPLTSIAYEAPPFRRLLPFAEMVRDSSTGVNALPVGVDGSDRERARPGQRDDLRGARPAQRAGARVERRAPSCARRRQAPHGTGQRDGRTRRSGRARGARSATRRAGSAPARGGAAPWPAARPCAARARRRAASPGRSPAPARAPDAREPARSSPPRERARDADGEVGGHDVGQRAPAPELQRRHEITRHAGVADRRPGGVERLACGRTARASP